MAVLTCAVKRSCIACLIPFTLLLSLYAEPLHTTISLPSVQWAPGQPEFSLDDWLTLDFTSDEPRETLEARVFEGKQSDLIAQARSSPRGICRPYSSFKLQVTSTVGTVTFNFRFLPYSIYDHANDSVHDKYYTIVIEKKKGPLNFKLSAEEAEGYFLSGKQIMVHVPAHQSEALHQARDAYNQERAAFVQNTPGAAQLVPVAERPEPLATCVVIVTKQNPVAINKPCSDQPSAQGTDTPAAGQ